MLWAPGEVDAVVDSCPFLLNVMLNRQAHNLQQGLMQVAWSFSPLCQGKLSSLPLPAVVSVMLTFRGDLWYLSISVEVVRLLVANMLLVIGQSNNFQ